MPPEATVSSGFDGAVTLMRCLWLVALLLPASPACAEWLRHYEDAEAVFYLDPATIARNGNLARVSTLEDLKQRGEIGEMSRRWVNEFDCDRKAVRVLSLSGYSGQMAAGRTLASRDKPSEWRGIQQGRTFETLLPFLCGVSAR